MQIKLLTGMRRGDLLRLMMSNLQEEGIHITRGKSEDSTGKRLPQRLTGRVAERRSAKIHSAISRTIP
jgi:integrase